VLAEAAAPSSSTPTSGNGGAPELAYAGVEASADERKGWGIIEID
jgi:hypothetical protein